MSKQLIGAAVAWAAIGLLTGPAQPALAGDTVVEKKVTTTNPSGTVVIENETSRTFKLDGHTHTYTAPADVDLPSYKGKEVTVYTDDSGKVTRIEKKTTVQP